MCGLPSISQLLLTFCSADGWRRCRSMLSAIVIKFTKVLCTRMQGAPINGHQHLSPSHPIPKSMEHDNRLLILSIL